MLEKTENSMPGLRAKLVIHTLKTFRKLISPEEMSVRSMRSGMEALMQKLPTPEYMCEQAEKAGAVHLRCVWGSSDFKPERGLVFLHGGGYGMGSSRSHRKLAARIGKRFRGRVFVPDYRLAPEHPFPAAVEDAVLVWQELRKKYPEIQYWALAGDSAGGGLSLALLQELQRLGEPLPVFTYLLSPWVDLACSSVLHEKLEKKDPYLDIKIVRAWGIQYAGDQLMNPLASPIYGGFTGAGRIMVQVGTHELLYADALMLKGKLENTPGVELKFSEWKGLFHVFQACEGLFPEAGEALDEAGKWMNECMS